MKKRKKSLLGWTSREEIREIKFVPRGLFDILADFTIAKHKFDDEDIKVRITIEEI